VVRTARGNLTDLERKLNLVLGPRGTGNHALPRAFAMTDNARAPAPETLLAGLPAGGAVILRHPDPAELRRMAERTVPLAHRLGAKVLVSGDTRTALAAGADGVHLPEALLARRPALGRLRPKPGWIVTAAAHGKRALRLAEAAGVDAVLLSPVLKTKSHPDAPALGALRFAALCRGCRLPVVALGGIKRGDVRRLRHSGLAGVAGIGLFDGA
jgi:thiamine-phosphate pyrophosphorylase